MKTGICISLYVYVRSEEDVAEISRRENFAMKKGRIIYINECGIKKSRYSYKM